MRLSSGYFILGLALLLGGCAIKTGKTQHGEVAPLVPAASPEFRRSAGPLLGTEFVAGNKITTLVNGVQIFPAMLDAIRSAKRSINFETYVYEDGGIAREFTEALAERARAGVKVNAIFDSEGTARMGGENMALLREAGVHAVKYHSILWIDPRRYNNRTHRKLLIIDGKTAFVGGAGIADEWSGNADSPAHWRDNHYEVTGPVVAQFQGVFVSNWMKTGGDMLQGEDYFPPLPQTGACVAGAIRSSARNPNLDLMYLLAIASARKTLRIENAYFLPDALLRKELMDAAKRGVDVQVVMPGKMIDEKLVRLASKRNWPELLRAGVKLYEYRPTMVHVKLMIVDDVFVSVGSGNFDNRSISLNDEANLNVLDRGFAAEQVRLFNKDRQLSHEVRLDRMNRKIEDVPFQQAAGVASPQL